ncbi:MAG TPA: hypothetical protein VF503_09335, partial [Sphingobium sp.]
VVNERSNDILEFKERARPAVQQEDRRPATIALAVEKMDILIIYRGKEVRLPIQLCFDGPPIVPVQPIGHEPAQISYPDARLPSACVGQIIPVILLNPLPDLIETGLRDGDTKGSDHVRSPRMDLPPEQV